MTTHGIADRAIGSAAARGRRGSSPHPWLSAGCRGGTRLASRSRPRACRFGPPGILIQLTP